jgi:putative transposase
MPIRQTPIITGEYYHIYNRGINKQPTFTIERDYVRAKSTLDYYRHAGRRPKFSYFLGKSESERNNILKAISYENQEITIIAYCLMPNHFHLLLKQNTDSGISTYLANFQNSYTKYFNAKHKRTGALFDRQFKAVLIESENQLLHVTRYIHLNPYSSRLVKFNEIQSYPYSSLPEYLTGHYHLSDPNSVLNITPSRYRNFVLDHADYQQQLEALKHYTLEIPGD